jgi:tetratricopeptide (TPR) repeat protein
MGGRVRRAARACFATRRRALATACAVAALAVGGWFAQRAVRASLAVRAAEAALAAYDFPAARAAAARATDAHPGHRGAWLLAAQAARRAGDLPAARDHLARAERLAGGPTPEGKLEDALRLVQQGEIERDIKYLVALADSGGPNTEIILEALTTGSNHAYQFDKTGFWAQQLLARFPKNPVGRLIRAQLDETLNKRDSAEARARELLADFPANHKARVLLAGLLFRAQKFAEAGAEYDALRAAQPDDPFALLGAARCRDRGGKPDEARALLAELTSRFPEFGEGLLESARLALKEDRAADAEAPLRRALALDPNDHDVRYNLGLCLERLNRTDEAREHFAAFKRIEDDRSRLSELLTAIVARPTDPAPRREAALVCRRNAQPAEALRWLRGALEIAPNDKLTHAALADLYDEQGVADRAAFHRARAK